MNEVKSSVSRHIPEGADVITRKNLARATAVIETLTRKSQITGSENVGLEILVTIGTHKHCRRSSLSHTDKAGAVISGALSEPRRVFCIHDLMSPCQFCRVDVCSSPSKSEEVQALSWYDLLSVSGLMRGDPGLPDSTSPAVTCGFPFIIGREGC